MKKNFLLVLSLLVIAGLWTGCSNDEAIEAPDGKQAISFRTQGGMPTPKTTGTIVEHVDAFVVYGTDDKAASNIFNGVTVARQAGSDNFDYNPKRYYSEGAATANFVAYSPVSKKISNAVVTALATTASFDYEVVAPDAINGNTSQEDLLIVGTNVVGVTEPAATTVNLTFQHALSRIFVQATNEMVEPVIIKGLTLKNLFSKGTITGTSAATWTWAWGTLTDLTDYPYVLAPSGVAVEPGVTTPTLVTSMEQGMMIVPQPIVNTAEDYTADDFALEVTYDVANLKDQKKYIYIDTTELPAFVMGQQYLITVNFTGTAITFTIDVADWGTPLVEYPTPTP